MKASPDQIDTLRKVARHLGPLGTEVVFVGGMIRGLLLTDPGASKPRATDDVDVIVEIASTAEYQTKLRERLVDHGFHEDTSVGAPVCRWIIEGIKVDVMPTGERVLGFSNPWYEHAARTATSMDLPADSEGVISIRVVSASAFCATKLVAFSARGEGNLFHRDIEDIVTVIDGRPELVQELEAEELALRKFVADALAGLWSAGLEEALPGHLEGDHASQARLPYLMCALRRITRAPRILQIGEKVTARTGGSPGATGEAHDGPWDYEIASIDRAQASSPPRGRDHIAVTARLTSHGLTAGVVGDGRHVVVEDSQGRRFPPLYKLLGGERTLRGVPDTYDQFLPNEPFDTVWVYELPTNATRLRLLLPFDAVELPFDLGA